VIDHVYSTVYLDRFYETNDKVCNQKLVVPLGTYVRPFVAGKFLIYYYVTYCHVIFVEKQ